MEKLKTVVVTVLTTLGVLFIIIMLMPDDEDEATEVANSEISAVSEIADNQFIPSSFFVDSKGHIVGKLLEGESFEATQNRLNSYLGK